MTGTPLDLTPFGSVLSGIGIVYWLLALGALALALIKPKGWRDKSILTVIVLLVFGWQPATVGWAQYKAQQKLNVAMARFEERCKTAGEKIYRTVEDVEGVRLTDVRSETKASDRRDPNWPDAALPDEGRGNWYMLKFLFWEHDRGNDGSRGFLNNTPSAFPGYKFVEIKAEDGGFRRIRLEKAESTNLISTPLNDQSARYAVGFENFVDPEDRKLWIAGTKVTITDTATKELMAEKIWYSVEPGQGSTAGFRSPWGFVKTCPSNTGWTSRAPTRFFVDRVLKPKMGE
jgi:hypothetical protein